MCCSLLYRTLVAFIVLLGCGLTLIFTRNDLVVIDPPLSDLWTAGMNSPDHNLALGIAVIVAAILLILSPIILGPEVTTTDGKTTVTDAVTKNEALLQDTVSADAPSSQEVTPVGSPDLESFRTVSPASSDAPLVTSKTTQTRTETATPMTPPQSQTTDSDVLCMVDAGGYLDVAINAQKLFTCQK